MGIERFLAYPGQKPIVIERKGSGWFIRVRVPTRRGGVIHNPDGDYVVRSTKPGGSLPGRPEYEADGEPYRFTTKASARSAAHQIGHYGLRLGDLAFGYVEGW